MTTRPSPTKPPIPEQPLTTTFRPPSDCLSNYFIVDNSFFRLGPDTSTCFPEGWNSTSQYFSPGICPSGYTVACSSNEIIGGTITETRATCCPSSYSCRAQRDATRVFYQEFPCTRARSNFDNPVINITTYIFKQVTTTIIYAYTMGNNDGVNAHGVAIRFQASELTLAELTAPGATTSVVAPTSTAMAAAASPLEPPDSGPAGLSSGAKAGIGIGVALAILLAVNLAFMYFLHRGARRSSRTNSYKLEWRSRRSVPVPPLAEMKTPVAEMPPCYLYDLPESLRGSTARL